MINDLISVLQLYGDAIVSFPMHRLVDLVSKHSDQPVYYYHFVYQGRFSWNTWEDTKKPFGKLKLIAHFVNLKSLNRVSDSQNILFDIPMTNLFQVLSITTI